MNKKLTKIDFYDNDFLRQRANAAKIFWQKVSLDSKLFLLKKILIYKNTFLPIPISKVNKKIGALLLNS